MNAPRFGYNAPMTTTLLPPPSTRVRTAWPRLLTAADLAKFPTSLPDGDVRYELDDGVLVVMAPPGGDHGRKQNKVCVLLTNEAESKGLGHAYGEVGIVLRRGPDRVPGADAAFLTADQLPARYTREGYLETIPKLVVEIRSKNDATPEIESKVGEYLAAGVVEVWVLDPDLQTIAKHRLDGVRTFGSGETLASDLLPDFNVPVALFFAD